MAIEKIPIELDLKTAKALRNVKSLKQSVGEIGDEAKGAGKQGADGLALMGKAAIGVGAGLAGVGVGLNAIISLMRMVYERQLAINSAVAEGIRAQRERISGAALTLQDPVWKEIQEVTGLSPTAAFRTTQEMASSYRLQQRDVAAAMKRTFAFSDFGTAAGQETFKKVLTFAGGQPTQAEPVAGLVDVLQSQFNLRGGKLDTGLGKIGAVAATSRLTTGEFASQLPRIASGLSDAGITDPIEQAAMLSAMSQYSPGQPEIAGMGLQQISGLTLRQRDPFTARLLAAAGFSGQTKDIREIMEAYSKYLREGGDIAKLAQETQMPIRWLRQVQRRAKLSFTTAFDRAMGAAKGAGAGDITKRLEKIRQEPAGQVAAGIGMGRLEAMDFDDPAAMMEIIEGAVKGEPGFANQAQIFHGAMTSGDHIQLDEPMSKDQTRKLFILNQTYRRVRWSLYQVSRAPGTYANDRIAYVAREHIKHLDDAKWNANRHHVYGKQQDYLDPFETAIHAALRFLAGVASGKADVSGITVSELGHQFPGMQRASAFEQEAAEGVNPYAPPPGRAKAQIVQNIAHMVMINSGFDPAVMDMVNHGTGPAPGEQE